MAGAYLLFALCLLLIHSFAGYDSRFHNGKYIVVDSPILRKLLMGKQSFFERRNRPQKDLNKMTVTGLTFYITALVTIVACVLMHLLLPAIPVPPLIMEIKGDAIYLDTLNTKITAIFLWLFSLSVMGYVLFEVLRTTKRAEQKWLKVLCYAICGIGFCAIAGVAFYMIWELVICFV